MATGGDAGFDLAPGETLVPGSVHTMAPAEASAEAATEKSEPVSSASDAAADAPPVPTPDADTNI